MISIRDVGGSAVQVAKWGNSLAVRLPKSLVARLGLKPGDRLEVVDAGQERLVVDKADARAAALGRMAARGWTRPEGWRFDRDEANER
jgi:antitoxin MazE